MMRYTDPTHLVRSLTAVFIYLQKVSFKYLYFCWYGKSIIHKD